MLHPEIEHTTVVERAGTPRMPVAAEIFDRPAAPTASGFPRYRPLDDDRPETREGRVLRDLARDVIDLEAQLVEALGDNRLLRETRSVLLKLNHDLQETVRRLRETIQRQSAIIREFINAERVK